MAGRGGNPNLPSWAQTSGHTAGSNPNLPSWAQKAAPATAVVAPKHHGGGGLFGALKSAAHWTAGKTELAATDLKNIPGGLVQIGKVAAQPEEVTWKLLTKGNKAALAKSKQSQKTTDALLKGTAQGVVQTVKHPLRDPFQTGLLATSVLSGAGSLAGRAAEAGRVASEGGTVADIAKATVAKPPVKPRFLVKNGEPTPLQPSKNPTVRAAQAVHDKVVQHAIDNNPDSKLASYGTKRIGMSQDETGRYQARMRAVPAQALDHAAKNLNGKLPGHVRTRVEQAALELTSVNTPAEDAARYHATQAEKGVEPARNRAVSKLYQKVADRGLLTKNEKGDVIVNAADHPRLAKADVALAKVQGRGDQILTRYGIRTPEDLQVAIDKPGRYRAGAKYEAPTPAKNGVPSQALLKQRAYVTRLETLHGRAVAKAEEKATPYANVHTRTGLVKQNLKSAPEAAFKRQHVEVAPGPRTPGAPSAMPAKGATTPTTERLGAALSVARDRLDQMEKAAAARVKPTGVVGGEASRPGRGFVSYRGEEPKAPSTPAASSPGPVVGETKAPIGSHVNTGANIAKGFVPKDVTGMAARHYRQIVRFQNTSERRAAAIRSGSDVKQTSRDVLVKVPGVSHEKISPVVNEILGKSKITSDDIEALHGALQQYKEDLIPGLRDRHAASNVPVGTSAKDAAEAAKLDAPEGYKWVDRNVLGDLGKPGAGPRGKLARSFDNVNSAVTAATVYFKIGHVGTRALTNAATSIIQGSATPLQIKTSLGLWHALSDEDRMRALAAAGQHGFEAMPHEGTSVASRVAGKGAQFWARRFDAPFRFNSIAFEARKAGFDTPAKFKRMLAQAEDPAGHGLNAAEHAKVDWVLKRANREGIAYDRLSPFERRFIARAFWFYPWLRGTANFAANTVLEHPYKAAVGGQAGMQGREQQAKDLGDLPTYERGLLKLGGSADHPLVTDLSTFSPFATPADVLDVASSKDKAAGFLNPAAAGIGALLYKLDPYGSPSKSPLIDSLKTAFGPAWPVQIANAYVNESKNQNRKMFKTTPMSALLRSLVGPSMPRRVNTHAAHSAAARQNSGR